MRGARRTTCRVFVRRPLCEGDVCYLIGNTGSKVKRRKVAVFNSARKLWDPDLHRPGAFRLASSSTFVTCARMSAHWLARADSHFPPTSSYTTCPPKRNVARIDGC